MARLTGDNIEKFRSYSGDGAGRRKYLTLKDKGDSAVGRILCNDASDVECYVVHRVKVGDYEREVNCLYDQGGSVEDCPFCKAKIARSAKIFIPFYNQDTDELQMFERPNSFYSKISSYCARFSPIINYEVEIVRNHEKDSKKPDFDIFPGKPDGTTIEDILDDCGVDEVPNVLGSYVLDKTADEMETYLQTGSFDSGDSVPSRRSRTVEAKDEEPADNGRISRRTSRGRGDRF